MSDSMRDDYRNEGHGHVYPRPDGIKARCGGPAFCKGCAIDATRKAFGRPNSVGDEILPQSIPESWIKHYVDQLLEIAGTLPEDSKMRDAVLLRAITGMDLVKAWREKQKP